MDALLLPDFENLQGKEVLPLAEGYKQGGHSFKNNIIQGLQSTSVPIFSIVNLKLRQNKEI